MAIEGRRSKTKTTFKSVPLPYDDEDMTRYISSAFVLLIALLLYNFYNHANVHYHMLSQLRRAMSTTIQQSSTTPAATTAAGATSSIINAASSTALLSRGVAKKVLSIETPEGAGALVRRSIGTPALKNISPFLMLDHFKVAEGAGFPDHPHRGQTTVTLMMAGQFQHEDFAGHSGKIGPGDLQWMSAGRGIMHAEMPIHRDEQGNKLPDPVGLQLWIDLPEKNKKDPPTYQEFPKEKVPLALPRADQPEETEGKGWSIKVIAGQSHGVQSPVRTPDQGSCWYLDVHLKEPGDRVFQEIPTGFNAFIYTLGPSAIRIGGPEDSLETHEPYHTLVLTNKANVTDPKVDPSTVPQENGVWIEHAGKAGQEARLVVIAGQPLDQKVYQYGPFVLSSPEAVRQTLLDYQMGINGFERAPSWKSKIGGR